LETLYTNARRESRRFLDDKTVKYFPVTGRSLQDAGAMNIDAPPCNSAYLATGD
jgi:hypothetical protein